MPQSARLSEGGGGCERYLGNARIDPATFSVGLPLHPHGVGIFLDHEIVEFSNPMCRLSDGAWRGGVPRQTGGKVTKMFSTKSDSSHFLTQVVSVIDVPEEVCDLNPIETCRYATKLVLDPNSSFSAAYISLKRYFA